MEFIKSLLTKSEEFLFNRCKLLVRGKVAPLCVFSELSMDPFLHVLKLSSHTCL